jgi:hypothetical protein
MVIKLRSNNKIYIFTGGTPPVSGVRKVATSAEVDRVIPSLGNTLLIILD